MSKKKCKKTIKTTRVKDETFTPLETIIEEEYQPNFFMKFFKNIFGKK